nr:hypothetical protein CFP56_35248 [Quercus suber]
MTGRRMESNMEKSTISDHDVNFGNHDSVNLDEAVSSTNKLKAFTLKAFHGLLNSLKNAVIKAKESISKALDHLVKSDEAFGFFEAFCALLSFLVSLLAGLNGLHFQVLGISPLDTHFALILPFIMTIIVYSIAYAEIKLQPLDAGLPILSPDHKGTASFIPTKLSMAPFSSVFLEE